MRGFVVFLISATVFLAGSFVFAPVCGDSGDLLASPLHQSLGKGHWERSVIISSGSIPGRVTECLTRIQKRNWPWHMTDYGHGPGMMGYWFGGFVMWIILIAIIAVVVYLIIRHTKQKETDTLMSETPRHILEKRYASGEISKEEFDEIRKDLET